MSFYFDSSRLQFAGEGDIDDVHWSFSEGNHPIPTDETATGQKLTIKWSDGSGGACESINQALGQGNQFNILVARCSSRRAQAGGPGVVVVAFDAAASAVELGWSNGTAITLDGLHSPGTGHRFAVSSLPAGENRASVRLVDTAGATIVEETVTL